MAGSAAAAAAAGYEELLKKHKFVNQATLNGLISDNHSRKLRDGMRDWKRFMLELGLSEDEMRLIDLQEPQDTMKRLIAMRKWKKKAGPKATYATFLDTCLRAREDELAEKMLALLNIQSEGMSPREPPRRQPEVSVRARVGSLERSFMALVSLLSNQFYNVAQELIIDFLLNSVPEDLTQTPEYVHIMLLDETDKLTEFIRVMDFWNTDLLGLIVQEFGTEDCVEAMASYQTEVAAFYSSVTVEACRMEEWEVREWQQDDIKTIKLQLASAWDDQRRTLQDLNEFKRKLQRRAGYEKHDVRLQSVSDVCTMVLVTEFADLGRLEHIHSDFFRTNNILKVTAAGKTIYNVESPKNYKATAVIPAPFICPITKQIMLDPHKTNCCGKHLSRAAIDASNHEEEAPVCPVCTASPTDAKPDPILRERTQSLRIYCPHKYEGCHWNGEIRHLKAHWNDAKNPCRYVLISCPKLCGKHVQQYFVDQHVTRCSFQHRCKVCSKRCERGITYCENCLETRTSCPYKCGDTIRPLDLLKHLKQCRTLFVGPNRDETDAAEVESNPDVQGSNYAFLDMAKSLLEKRLQSEEVRCNLVDNLLSLAKVHTEKKTGEEVKKAKQDLRELESLLLVRDNTLHEQMENLQRRMDRDRKERKKPPGLLSSIKLE